MDLSQAIANINMALHNNLSICIIKKTKQTKGLLKILHELGLIRSIQSKGLNWVVTLKSVFLSTNTTTKWAIKCLTKASKAHLASNYQMHSVTWKNRRAFYILTNSTQGLFCAPYNPYLLEGGLVVAVIIPK